MLKHDHIRSLPSAKYLRSIFTYSPNTGVVRWKIRPRKHFATQRIYSTWNSRFAGKRAGWSMQRGHLIVSINKTKYLLHRVIWKMMTGKEPSRTIDHRDGNSSNNQFSNLREATQQEQTRNKRSRRDNTSGVTGVDRSGNKWRVRVADRHCGLFASFDEAVAVRTKQAKKLYGDFYRG